MMARTLGKMTVGELVEMFAVVAAQQNDAMLEEDIARVNRLFQKLMAIQSELKTRDGDKRTELISLYSSPNMHVRLKAAKSTLAVAPVAAREQLEAIEASGVQPQAGDAGMSLWALDRGIFKPT